MNDTSEAVTLIAETALGYLLGSIPFGLLLTRAAGLGDIGRHFPDTDVKWKGADSRVLLRGAMALVAAAGWRVGNVDCTIIAEAPKVAPHAAAMCANIADDLGITPQQVNIKGKTTEQLGFTGRGEGIAAQAVVLLQRS